MTTTRGTDPRARSARPAARAGGAERPLLRGPAWLDGPMTSSHLVLGSAGLLLVIGLIMVFSASSIEAALADQPAWLPGVRQIAFAVLGLVGMFAAMRLPVSRLRQWSGVGLLVVFFLLALVLVPIPGLSLELNGSRAWFNLGVTNFQPSELAKLVVALWGAHVLALRERYLTTRTLLVPILPVFGLLSLLLMMEPDMGAVVSLGLVVAGLLWAGGLSWRGIAAGVVVVAGAVTAMILIAPYRMARLASFLDPCADASDGGYQACRGLRALATGGIWGVGLGNSAMKWNLLPHAESDYIFAIIGEELGLLGCVVVVSLYGILAYAGFRIAHRSTDRFVQLASVAITTWLVGQAAMNMGYVVGLLPVTGVQLPLISAGGTSLVLTLFIVGLLARFARSEPQAIAASAGQPRSRLARLLLPVPAAAVDPLPRRRRGARTRPGPAEDGRTVARVPGPVRRTVEGPGPVAGPAAGRPRAPSPRREPQPPPEAPGRRDRQTVRGRPPADQPSGRVRPAPRTRTPRTERPGRPQ